MDTILEIIAVICTLLYVYLQIKQRWGTWIAGIIASLLYVYIFYVAKLYADASLNIYFALAGVYGMWCWRKRKSGDNVTSTLPITRTTMRQGIIYAIIAAALFAFMCYILARHTDSPTAAADAFLTALSIIGTYMGARKKLEQWHVWIVVNTLSVGLYYYKDLYPTVVLYAIMTAMSFRGLWCWRSDMIKQPAT